MQMKERGKKKLKSEQIWYGKLKAISFALWTL